MNGASGISSSLFQPMHSTVQAAGKIGSFLGRKAIELVGPKLIQEASVRAAIAAVGNSTLGSAVGLAAVPVLSPVITPVAAWAVGMLASQVVTYGGNLIYEAVAKPGAAVEPIKVEPQKGLFESVGPGMFANGLIKGLEIVAEGTPVGKVVSIVKPVAVPLVSEVVGGVARHLLVP